MMRRLKSFASGRSSSASEQVILIHTNTCIRVFRLGNQINQSIYNAHMYVCAPVIFVYLTLFFWFIKRYSLQRSNRAMPLIICTFFWCIYIISYQTHLHIHVYDYDNEVREGERELVQHSFPWVCHGPHGSY